MGREEGGGGGGLKGLVEPSGPQVFLKLEAFGPVRAFWITGACWVSGVLGQAGPSELESPDRKNSGQLKGFRRIRGEEFRGIKLNESNQSCWGVSCGQLLKSQRV